MPIQNKTMYIGRESCMERVYDIVYISVFDVKLKKIFFKQKSAYFMK